MEAEKILVVDDNKEIVYSISELLKYEGYETLKAYDGMEALDIMERENVDLILLDVMMPRLNGLSALMKLREKSRIPVIILSAKTEESDKGGKDGKVDKETDGMQNPQNCMQDADNFTENADNSEQNKTEQNKANENRELRPLTPPPGEDVGVWRKYSFIEFPGYAYNKNTHNLECLLLALDGLHINDPNDTKAILKLSDYGRLGNEVWKIIHATKWSIVNSKGKYLIGALNKARTQG